MTSFDADGSTKVLAGLLQARTGQVISPTRFWRIETALKPVMRTHGIPDLDALVAVLMGGDDDKILAEAIEAMLNNESFFFRDAMMFDILRSQVLPALQTRREAEKRLRIWCAGCSTGQEAYSIAMLIADQASRWTGWKIEIIGTDISQGVLEKARGGRYTQFEIQRGLSVAAMLRYFTQDNEQWVIDPAILRMVQFRHDNLLRPSVEIGPFDLILCRNVLMYFSDEMRRTAFTRLARSLRGDGFLMLGAAETVIGHTDRFESNREIRGVYCPTPETVGAFGTSPFDRRRAG